MLSSNAIVGQQCDRERLAAECQLHAAPHLQRFVLKALSLLDIEVQNGRRTYAQVNALNVITVATKLFHHEANAAVAQTRPLPTPVTVEQTIGYKRERSPPSRGEEKCQLSQVFVQLLNGAVKERAEVQVGRSTQLERNYSRDEPSMDDIRPLEILRKAFPFVVKRSKQLGNQYLYDQLKGMRQDLRVQNIRNPFAVSVYEQHARVCLELKNLSEFNQCQSALRSFYSDGTIGESGDAFDEFLCYRLMWLSLGDKDDLMALELKEAERALRSGESHVEKRTAQALKSQSVLLVLRFCTCVQQGDSVRALKIARYFDDGLLKLLRLFLQRQRIRWLRDLGNSTRGKLTFSYVLTLLGIVPLPPKHQGTLMRQASESVKRQIKLEIERLQVVNVEFLDGSLALARTSWEDLVKMLKITTPSDFNFENEVTLLLDELKRSVGCPVPTRDFKTTSIDSVELAKSVGEYCSFLTTRSDIATE